MDRINIQFKTTKMPTAAKVFLIACGLFIAGLAIYKSSQDFSIDKILIALVGLATFLMGFDPFSPRKPYLLINDSKIEYKISKIGQPWTVMFDEIDSFNFDKKRLRIDFNLTNARHKILFLRLFPKDIRMDIIDTINRISIDKK